MAGQAWWNVGEEGGFGAAASGERGGRLTMRARSARSAGQDQRSVTVSRMGRLKYCRRGSGRPARSRGRRRRRRRRGGRGRR